MLKDILLVLLGIYIDQNYENVPNVKELFTAMLRILNQYTKSK
jgi:hypothetical protein